MHLAFLLIGLLPALLFSQVPEFMQQYHQRIGGAVDELERIVRHFDEDSQRSGYDRHGALGLMARNPERLIRDQTVRMEENIVRLARLRKQQQTFRDGSLLVRFASFVTDADSELRAATWVAFQPGLSLTFDGVVWPARIHPVVWVNGGDCHGLPPSKLAGRDVKRGSIRHLRRP